MGEWGTYSFDDFLMFSPRAWYRMLELHNRAWWPMQPVVALLGGALVGAMYRRLHASLRLALVFVGTGLLFVAGAFHAGPHASINLAAPYYAAAFALEGMLLIGLALLRPALVLARADGATRLVSALLVFALLLYPLLALVAMRPLAQTEWFALAPDPTMLAALALAVMLYRSQGRGRARISGAGLAVVPLAWCALSGLTLWTLGVAHWWPLPMAALLAVAAAAWPVTRH